MAEDGNGQRAVEGAEGPPLWRDSGNCMDAALGSGGKRGLQLLRPRGGVQRNAGGRPAASASGCHARRYTDGGSPWELVVVPHRLCCCALLTTQCAGCVAGVEMRRDGTSWGAGCDPRLDRRAGIVRGSSLENPANLTAPKLETDILRSRALGQARKRPHQAPSAAPPGRSHENPQRCPPCPRPLRCCCCCCCCCCCACCCTCRRSSSTSSHRRVRNTSMPAGATARARLPDGPTASRPARPRPNALCAAAPAAAAQGRSLAGTSCSQAGAAQGRGGGARLLTQAVQHARHRHVRLAQLQPHRLHQGLLPKDLPADSRGQGLEQLVRRPPLQQLLDDPAGAGEGRR
jgi:hypothetical protein